MRVLSLFSGVGGFDMGLEAAGMTTAFQCEIDKHARSVLDHHWPDVPKWDDVTTLTGAYILEATGGVDVVAWGSPCQDLSLAGKRAGLAGTKSGLFHEGIRIIKELRELSNGQYPTWSIWENVVGALSSNRGSDFGQVLYEMDEAGACFSEWAVLDAQHFGVPQRRRRVFITSCFDSATSSRCPEPLLPVTKSLSGDIESSKQERESFAQPIESSIIDSGCTVEPLLFENSYRDGVRMAKNGISQTLSAKMGTGGNNTPMTAQPVLIRDREGKLGGGKGPLVSENKSLSLRTANDQVLISTAYPIQDGREIEKKQNGLGIAEAGEPSYTLDQTGSQAVAYSIREDAKANNFSATEVETARALQALQPSVQSHHAQTFIAEPSLVVRRLTPLECERLMGWPDNHTATGTNGDISDTQRYKMCGNGVASPVAAWIGKQIINV